MGSIFGKSADEEQSRIESSRRILCGGMTFDDHLWMDNDDNGSVVVNGYGYNLTTPDPPVPTYPDPSDPNQPELLIYVQWWMGILELLVFVIGTPANTIVLYLALLKRKSSDIQAGRKRNITKYLVISMTFADLLFCFIHSPMMFLAYNMEIDFGSAPCLTLFAVTHLSTVASSLSLLLININKFLHLRRPLHYALYVTTYRGSFCLISCWLISAGWSLLFIFGPFMVHNERCDVMLTHKSVYVLFAVGFFVVPTLISLLISFYVAVVVFKTRENAGKCSTNKDGQYNLPNDLQSCYSSLYTSNHSTRKCSSRTQKNSRLSHNQDSLEKTSTPIASIAGNLLVPPPTPGMRLTRAISFRHQSLETNVPKFCRQLTLRNRSSARSRFRRIGFVFTTTVWSTLTVLPYRGAFIIWNLTSVYHERDDLKNLKITNGLAETIYFCLFALMALNAVGNPFITIMTQRQYTIKFVRVWERIWKKRRAIGRMVRQNDGHLHIRTTVIFEKKRRISL